MTMKRVKTTKEPFKPGLVRDTPSASQSRAQGASEKALAAELRPVPSRRCPVDGGKNATIAVEIGFVQMYICQRCFDKYATPVRGALNFIEVLQRFL